MMIESWDHTRLPVKNRFVGKCSPSIRTGFIVISIFFVLGGGSANAAEPNEENLLAKVKQLESRLTQIESDQKTILEKQQEIITQLETLRVWVRRS